MIIKKRFGLTSLHDTPTPNLRFSTADMRGAKSAEKNGLGDLSPVKDGLFQVTDRFSQRSSLVAIGLSQELVYFAAVGITSLAGGAWWYEV